MNHMRKILALAAVVLVFSVTACKPTEPTMTITGKVRANESIVCGLTSHIDGKVTPATATPKVVLQWTVGGKWVDVDGYRDQDDYYDPPVDPTIRQATVNQSTGAYTIEMMPDWTTTTRHMRVRSNGGGYVSPGFYMKPVGSDGSVC